DRLRADRPSRGGIARIKDPQPRQVEPHAVFEALLQFVLPHGAVRKEALEQVAPEAALPEAAARIGAEVKDPAGKSRTAEPPQGSRELQGRRGQRVRVVPPFGG